MIATQIDTVTDRDGSGVGELLLRRETDEQRVIDFYRTIGSSYFGAVVSAWDINASTCGSSCRPRVEPRPTLVTLVGELDISTVPLLRTCFAQIEGDIDVDCSGLTHVDAQGLGIFVSAGARCERAAAKFVLVEPTGALLRLLRITGLGTRLEVRSDSALVR